MRYMLQVRFNGADSAMGTLAPDRQRSIRTEFQGVQRLPGVIDAHRLQPATTTRIAAIRFGASVEIRPTVEG